MEARQLAQRAVSGAPQPRHEVGKRRSSASSLKKAASVDKLLEDGIAK